VRLAVPSSITLPASSGYRYHSAMMRWFDWISCRLAAPVVWKKFRVVMDPTVFARSVVWR